MEGSSQDPPLYSTLIMLIRLISGSMNFVVVLQTIFIGCSIIYFTKTVATHFNLNVKIKIFISLLLFLPILEFYNKILDTDMSNLLMSSLTYDIGNIVMKKYFILGYFFDCFLFFLRAEQSLNYYDLVKNQLVNQSIIL